MKTRSLSFLGRVIWVALLLVFATSAGTTIASRAMEFEAQEPMCFGELATIVGTPASDDPLEGTDGDDVIVALGGDDIVFPYGGNDKVCLGPGNDYVNDFGLEEGSFGGDDMLAGQRGRDRLIGGDGNDVLMGGRGRDSQLDGGTGDDRIDGGPGIDTLWYDQQNEVGEWGPVTVDLTTGRATGQEGSDELVVGTLENVTLNCGVDLDDTVIGDDRANRIDTGAGDDTIIGRGGDDVLLGGRTSFGDAICGDGLDGNDRIDGGMGDDILRGFRGDDALNGGPGEDRLNGGPGTDTCVNGETVRRCE